MCLTNCSKSIETLLTCQTCKRWRAWSVKARSTLTNFQFPPRHFSRGFLIPSNMPCTSGISSRVWESHSVRREDDRIVSLAWGFVKTVIILRNWNSEWHVLLSYIRLSVSPPSIQGFDYILRIYHTKYCRRTNTLLINLHRTKALSLTTLRQESPSSLKGQDWSKISRSQCSPNYCKR